MLAAGSDGCGCGAGALSTDDISPDTGRDGGCPAPGLNGWNGPFGGLNCGTDPRAGDTGSSCWSSGSASASWSSSSTASASFDFGGSRICDGIGPVAVDLLISPPPLHLLEPRRDR